jgi:hypothetical protein
MTEKLLALASLGLFNMAAHADSVTRRESLHRSKATQYRMHSTQQH